ncbi:MAG: glycoside hydrolase family 2 TIM barrel-domain containing protein, partial [Bacteroidota bacterium]|nr:glycoside hydrolase family 2 TIM barrel-domain containing protein [Bacteroidota bacterium]
DNVVAVWADNSDDPTYPPGKPQSQLDFCYFGGIYRDVWLVSTNKVYITDANTSGKVAGGGVFVHFEDFSEKKVTVVVQTEVTNELAKDNKYELNAVLLDKNNKEAGTASSKFSIKKDGFVTITQKILVTNPHLWHPDDPHLYNLVMTVKDKNQVVDGLRIRVGIRKIEFRGKDGFFLNNKPFGDKLIGTNRHQDYAIVGNAVPNSKHWLDVKKLRDAGTRIIRSAHYPQDPAFMDACDELGMFMIVPTPGWQFWNKAPEFEQRVISDIRNMVRRDRNHPSVLLWEPILNETNYPDYFAQKVHQTVHEEYPFQGAYTACDLSAKGSQYFDVVYSHSFKSGMWFANDPNWKQNYSKYQLDFSKIDRSVFTREWGDNVDDWTAHNSNSRVARGWGEHAQLVQAIHYASPSYLASSFETMYRNPDQFVGGALWHSFDHNRGYHPDPFYGGIMDNFRQPKYSYYLFMSQRDPNIKLENADSGPMIYIANELTPFSENDVYVFTNCDEVRLIVMGKDTLTQKVNKVNSTMRHPMVIFKDAYSFANLKSKVRRKGGEPIGMVAEGLINGKVVARENKTPAMRPTKIQLKLDYPRHPLVADGSDFVTVIASVTDDDNVVKRLNDYTIQFEIEGQGKIIGDETISANPEKVEWGTAPVLIRSTTTPGKIKVKAHVNYQGVNMPAAGELVFESVPSPDKLMYLEEPSDNPAAASQSAKTEDDLQQLRKLQQDNKNKLIEVGKQQEQFEK